MRDWRWAFDDWWRTLRMAGCNDSCGTDFDQVSAAERRTLGIVLVLNAAMFVAEFSAGLAAASTALLADSLDMLADALIYALGLFALGRAAHWRIRAALASGLFQMVLGVAVSLEAVSKLFVERIPDPGTMGFFGVLALLVNTICFLLLARYRDGEINLRATWICSRNDMLGNIGVLLAAVLVGWMNSMWPDILIGLLIAMVVIKSALRIGIEAYSGLKNSD
jgi:cation diffusion facilitator family transporter